MKTQFFYILAILTATLFSSCKEDEKLPQSQAKFSSSNSEVPVGQVIQFTNNSQNATSFKWSFGDGTTSDKTSPRKIYKSSNVFLVSLVSTGSGGSTISNMKITVTPASSFNVKNLDNLKATKPVEFVNNSLEATSYLWSFGDKNKSTSKEKNPKFTYPNSGSYTVSLTAINSFGKHTFSKKINIDIAPPTPTFLYYIAYGDKFLRKLNLDETKKVTNIYNMAGKGGVGLAYDGKNKKIYFSDFDTRNFGNIWRINVDGTGIKKIAKGISDPYAIALDVADNKVYWVDDKSNISKANLDGSNPKIGFVKLTGTFKWRAISLDTKNRKMYFYDAKGEKLYVSNMDGTNPKAIITKSFGYAVFVDSINKKIYYEDQRKLKIANLDGSNIKVIDNTRTRIYGLQIDYSTNKLYWSGRDSGQLNRANLDGSDKEILKSGITSPRGITIVK